MKSYIADRSGGQPAASSTKGPASRQTFPSPIEGLRWTATVEGKHMSQNQIIAVVAALVILIAIIGWTVGRVKWAGILLQGLCTLVAIAMVHSDNKLTCAITLTLFATGIALSLLLIAAYSRPFTGEISVRPDLLKQVITSAPAATPP